MYVVDMSHQFHCSMCGERLAQHDNPRDHNYMGVVMWHGRTLGAQTATDACPQANTYAYYSFPVKELEDHALDPEDVRR
jgi:hypothetical protein